MKNQNFTQPVEDIINSLPKVQRLLAIDVGRKRIGIAVSDPSRLIANPLPIIKRDKWKNVVSQINAIANEATAGGIIIGYPLHLDGGEGTACQAVRSFCRSLHAEKIGVPLALWDERLTTQQSQKILVNEANVSRSKRTEITDSLAASIILQAVLDLANQ